MRSLLGILVAALAALLIVPTASVATSAVSVARVSAYNYDGHHHTEEPTYTATERGPPAIAYAYNGPRLAVDATSHGPSTRPQLGSAWACTTYDHRVRFVQVDNGSGTTRTASDVGAAEVRAVLGSRCAAKSGKARTGSLSATPGQCTL